MSDIKKLKPLSEWLEFELEAPPAWLDGSTVKFRVRPISGLAGFNVTAEDRAPSAAFAAMVIDSIEAWGFTNGGEPIPCNTETKQEYAGNLRVLLGAGLKDKKGLLGIELATYAADPENFLKN
jgi:hypothetical protein